ncbi:MAG: NADH:ubiquinone reductase (Na(+)-transporting) subunit C [Flavobacteriaceae bacterium]
MNKDSNFYTFLFSLLMVLVVASSLALTSESLKEKQNENVVKEKMQNIISTIGVKSDRDQAQELYKKYIKSELALLRDGTVDVNKDAFLIDLSTEIKKDINQQRYPLFVAEMDEKKYFIIPLRGSGLWDAIWGYVALEDDMSTIKGIVFDHKGETAGLGAEITQQWFQDRFVGEKIFNSSSKLVGINVSKLNNDPKNLDKNDHEVDAISGATITGDGVSDMIMERLNHYISYFNKYKSDNNILAMKDLQNKFKAI